MTEDLAFFDDITVPYRSATQSMEHSDKLGADALGATCWSFNRHRLWLFEGWWSKDGRGYHSTPTKAQCAFTIADLDLGQAGNAVEDSGDSLDLFVVHYSFLV